MNVHTRTFIAISPFLDQILLTMMDVVALK